MSSSSETHKTPNTNLSLTFRSEKPHINPKLQVIDSDPLSCKTPKKPLQIRHKTLRESTQKEPTVQIDSATRKIDSWPDENLIKNHVRASEKLPEKYEMLGAFFDSLDTSIRLLRLRGLRPNFSNICPKIKCLTDRRFTYSHLAQLKFIFPEVIEIKKVLVKDERTGSVKADLQVAINVDAIENDEKLKSEGCGHMHLRTAFRDRLADITKSHPEDYEIPEETLPQPFRYAKQDLHPGTKFSVSSSPKLLTDVHTLEMEVSKTRLQGEEILDETHSMPSDQLKEDLSSNISGTPVPSLPTKTSFGGPIEQQPEITAHLPQSFRRHSKPSFQARNVSVSESNLNVIWSSEESATTTSYGQSIASATPTKATGPTENEQQPKITSHLPQSFRRHFSQPSFQDRNVSVPDASLNIVCSVEEAAAAASSYCKVPATPTKVISPIENDEGLPPKGATIESTPAKLASTPARLMTVTPALHPPKRGYMSPDEICGSSPEKLVRRAPRSRSLKFDTPVKNEKFEDEVLDMDSASTDNAYFNILPEDLSLSLNDEEKAIEEENPGISEAKSQQQMISSLHKLFNTIHFLSQSLNCYGITKEELVHKIIWKNCDFDGIKEIEEQLMLLLQLVPEWISERKLTSEEDLLLIYINKTSNPDSVRARLEEAK